MAWVVVAQGLSHRQSTTRVAASDPITLNIAMDEPLTLDPAKATDSASTDVIEQLFIGLVDFDDETGEVVPELATGWTVSPDGRTYTFTLRSDVQWIDGHPVTAEDVRYGILRTLAPETNSGYAFTLYIIENGEPYHVGDISDPSQVGVTAVDSTTLRIRLEHPASYALSILTMWIARPMPQWAIETHGGAWIDPANIVTNGPYELSEWAHDDHIILDKSPIYCDAENVQIERVRMWMVDLPTEWHMYLDGELDTATAPSLKLGEVRTDPLLSQELVTAPSASTFYCGFSVSQEPFGDPLVRKAFSAAIDRRGLISEVLGGVQLPALTYTPPGVFGHVDGYAEGVGLPYDPTQARQHLADAGYPDGDGLPTITFWVPPESKSSGEYIRDSWQATLGVSVTLDSSLAWGDYLAALPDGEFQIWWLGWRMDYADANNFLNDGARRQSHGDWNNPTYESLLEQAAEEQDPSVRRALYKQAEEILVETDAVKAPLWYGTNFLLIKPHLERTYPAGKYDIADWRITRESIVIGTDGGELSSDDGDTTVQVPPGAFTATVVITHTPVTGMPPAGNLNRIGNAFDLTAVYSDTGRPARLQPGYAYTVTAAYSDTELGPTAEDTLGLYRWDESGGAWTQQGVSSSVSTTDNVVTARVDHFSEFALLGEKEYRLHLPLVLRGG
jgi:oligopeptide transport system substrate-binding protein